MDLGNAEFSSYHTLKMERPAAGPIGVTLDATDSVSLVVVNILPGAIQQWNRTHLNPFNLQVNDRIVEINGRPPLGSSWSNGLSNSALWCTERELGHWASSCTTP